MSRTAPQQEALSEPLLEVKEEALSEEDEGGGGDEPEEDEGGGGDSCWNLIGVAPWKLASARAAQARQLAQEDHPDADAGIADADADGPTDSEVDENDEMMSTWVPAEGLPCPR